MSYIPVNFGASNLGNTAGTSGTVSHQLVFAGGNNVTLSQSKNGGSATITISAGAGGAGGSNTLGMSNLGNTSGTSGVISGSAVQFAFAGGNNVTLSQSINASSATITISGPNTVAQSNQTVGLYALGNTTQNSSTTLDARTLSFNALGAATMGYSNGSIQVSVPTQTTQTQNLHNVTLSGNTAGAMAHISSGTMTLAGGDNITLSQAGNAITISGGAGGGAVVSNAIQSVASATNSGTNTSRFAADDHVHAGVFAAGASNLGNTAGNTAVLPGQIVFAGGDNITLSQSTSANNNMTITISGGAGGGAGVTLSTWEPWPIHNTGTGTLSAATATSASASFIPFVVGQHIAAGYLNMIQTMSLITGGTSSFQQSATHHYGLYSRGTGANSTTLGSITSGSYSYAMTYNNSTISVSQPTATSLTGFGYGSTSSAGLNVSSGYTGLKLVRFPVSSTITPGVYWLGLFARGSSSSFNSGIRVSYLGNFMTLTGLAPMGSFSSAYSTGTNILGGQGGNWQYAQGAFTSAGQTNLPSSLAISAMTQNIQMIPYMKFVST